MTTQAATKQAANIVNGVDVDYVTRHLTEFIGSIMGGPSRLSNKDLEQAHRFLDITDGAFDEMVSLMVEAFYDLHFDQDDVDFMEEELMRRRRFIVGRKAVGLASSF